MHNTILLILFTVLLTGCVGLPTIESIPTTVMTPISPTSTSTATAETIEITGTVYVRDDEGNIKGWLHKDVQVQATCSGDWCNILSGGYQGYHFWRGCSADNPEHKYCQTK